MSTESGEQLAQTRLAEIAEFATKLVERSGTPDGFTVQPGSPLAVDDSLSSPYELSYAAEACLTAAIDHLHAACALVLSSGFLHLSAPATVARGTLECASTALWMLAPDASDERITRGLRWYFKDASDGDTAGTEADIRVPSSLQTKKDNIRAVAEANGLSFNTIKCGYTSTEAVKAAKVGLDAFGHPFNLVYHWRLCSGFAHGRLWPRMELAKAAEGAQAEASQASPTILRNSYERVLASTITAGITLLAAVDRYDRLVTAP